MKRSFKDLSAAEVLALAVSLEEEDGRLLGEFARQLRPNYPRAAEDLDAMREEEDSHRHRLVELFRKKYGLEIPLLQREDVRGFVRRDPLQSVRPGTSSACAARWRSWNWKRSGSTRGRSSGPRTPKRGNS